MARCRSRTIQQMVRASTLLFLHQFEQQVDAVALELYGPQPKALVRPGGAAATMLAGSWGMPRSSGVCGDIRHRSAMGALCGQARALPPVMIPAAVLAALVPRYRVSY